MKLRRTHGSNYNNLFPTYVGYFDRTGVYVDHVNAKVRDRLWRRVCENIKEGQATMVYTASNEQHMSFRVHNTS